MDLLWKLKFINAPFISTPNAYRCCVGSRWTVQRSNRCLFAGLPRLTFSAGKDFWHKTLVIPRMTSGWSTEVSTFLSTVPYSGTHIWMGSKRFDSVTHKRLFYDITAHQTSLVKVSIDQVTSFKKVLCCFYHQG